ncbi:MAG: hypothetical protein ACD_20C00316G0006 [uncultured bacterium]|nr:MAG: hypothetical protein ACD_20C00316G0006 [uncultured bacterium]HBH17587.1 hypothetical protein [Cyanobacteria bacterium UBA9579]
MSIDIKKAFTFPFKAANWPQKLLIGGIFFFAVFIIHTIIGFLNAVIMGTPMAHYEIQASLIVRGLEAILSFIMSILAILVYAIPFGYALQSAHNEINGKEPLLPDWDSKFLDYFKYGMYFFAINILYLFILVAIAAVPTMISGVVFGLYQDNPIVSLLSLTFVVLFVAPFILIYLAILPFIATTYADNFNFQDSFKLDKVFIGISRIIPDYLASLGLSLVILLLIPFLLVLSVCTCIGILLIPFLILPALLIVLNLFSQAHKQSKIAL